jgi:hypothetical protein
MVQMAESSTEVGVTTSAGVAAKALYDEARAYYAATNRAVESGQELVQLVQSARQALVCKVRERLRATVLNAVMAGRNEAEIFRFRGSDVFDQHGDQHVNGYGNREHGYGYREHGYAYFYLYLFLGPRGCQGSGSGGGYGLRGGGHCTNGTNAMTMLNDQCRPFLFRHKWVPGTDTNVITVSGWADAETAGREQGESRARAGREQGESSGGLTCTPHILTTPMNRNR